MIVIYWASGVMWERGRGRGVEGRERGGKGEWERSNGREAGRETETGEGA